MKLFGISILTAVIWLTTSMAAQTKKPETVDLRIDFIFKPEWDDTNRQSVIVAKVTNLGAKASKEAQMILMNYDRDYTKKRPNNLVETKYKAQVMLPPLKAKQSHLVEFTLDHWVYDPNCEIEVRIILHKTQKDSNPKDNTSFFEQGG